MKQMVVVFILNLLTGNKASCDCNENHYNNNLKYIINHCIFEGNAATFGHKNHKKYSHYENYTIIYTSGVVLM